jgi:hypothetical protein
MRYVVVLFSFSRPTEPSFFDDRQKIVSPLGSRLRRVFVNDNEVIKRLDRRDPRNAAKFHDRSNDGKIIPATASAAFLLPKSHPIKRPLKPLDLLFWAESREIIFCVLDNLTTYQPTE